MVNSIDLLVLQPTPFCNLDCDYCYLPQRNNPQKISSATLKASFSRVFESGLLADRLTVVWHAGEPLVMPIGFYKEAFDIAERLRPPQCVVDHCLQSNGVLLNQAWCNFIRESDFRIGISIDGPAFLHDRHRKTRNGRGSFQRTLKGIRLLQDNGIVFHVITVLTRDSLQYPDELFDFYMENGISKVGLNIEEIEGFHQDSTLAVQGVEEEYRRFIARFFRLVKQAQGRLSVREFNNTMGAIYAPSIKGVYNHQVTPFAIVSIDHLGNISTFSPELIGQPSRSYNDFVFGNVYQDELLSICTNPAYLKLAQEIQKGVQRCREQCEYFSICGGGAPANKYYEHQSFSATETVYCRLVKKAIADLVLSDQEGNEAEISVETPGCSEVSTA